MSIIIELNTMELMIAATVGSIRRCQNIRDGEYKTERWGIEANASWQTDIDGAAAEMAVAKYRGEYWGGSYRTFKMPDVGEFQVRATSNSNGHLIVRPKDNKIADDMRFLLVIICTPKFELVGSLSAGDARQGEFWRPDKGSWWVPQSALQQLTALEYA